MKVTSKKSLLEFVGCISETTADKMEKAIRESRKRHAEAHKKRMDAILKAFKE